MKSPIRWAGSKRQMLCLLRRFWSGAGTYIEPFAGSACLFFDLAPQRAILGDMNGELINSYRHLRDDPDSVMQVLRQLMPRKSAYYAVRAQSPDELPGAEAAARFFYLNRYCFNGLYRTNTRGEFNVPIGNPKGTPALDEDTFMGAARLLSSAKLMNADFEATLAKAARGDFAYLDPPYVTSSRRVFSEYGAHSFDHRDLTRLDGCLKDLDKRGVSFVVTYSDCPEARRLLKKWNPRRWRARRNIAGFAAHRRFSYELIATNRAYPS